MGETPDVGQLLRKLPQIDRFIQDERVEPLVDRYSRSLVLVEMRNLLDSLRKRAIDGTLEECNLDPSAIVSDLSCRLEQRSHSYYCRVINATGVVLHTGLGRAPLAPEVADTLGELARHPLRVEIDLESGQRGGRDHGCRDLLCEITGAEDATVVNNNAGATLLLLAALARGRDVLISHGELVEIGGSFRIPEIMEEGGARLKAVGTTNRTRTSDYAKAIDDETGMILKVHTSNYRVVGFTEEVEIDGLVEIGKKHGVAVVHDMGSGSLINLEKMGHPGESMVAESISAGCDLVCFSGDKLLGGPQAGIICGSHESVERCRQHPLFRALRPGRLTYVALEQTLRIYLRGDERAVGDLPSLERLLVDPALLEERARALVSALQAVSGVTAAQAPHSSLAGSGSLPTRAIESRAVAVGIEGLSASDLARRLRTGEPSILPIVRDDTVLLDVRTIAKDEITLVSARVEEIAASPS